MQRSATLFLMLILSACSSAPEPQSSAARMQALQEKEAQRRAEQQTNRQENIEEVATATIYYRHPSAIQLLPVERSIIHRVDVADQVKQVIDLLSLPPKGSDAMPVWPDNIYVREIFLMENGTIVVDFSSSFLTNLAVGASDEAIMIASLVASLTENFAPYDKVRILVDGEIRESLMGHVDIEGTLNLRFANRYLEGYEAPTQEASKDVIVTEEIVDPVRNALQDNLGDDNDPDGR